LHGLFPATTCLTFDEVGSVAAVSDELTNDGTGAPQLPLDRQAASAQRDAAYAFMQQFLQDDVQKIPQEKLRTVDKIYPELHFSRLDNFTLTQMRTSRRTLHLHGCDLYHHLPPQNRLGSAYARWSEDLVSRGHHCRVDTSKLGRNSADQRKVIS